jgi:DivIVA domain-containing protein
MSAPAANERRFTRSRRGYEPAEVDDYLERFAQYAAKLEDRAVAAESALEDCGNALAELRGRLQAATGTELSGRLAEILRLAEEEANDIRDRAHAEAQAMTEHATREADELRRAAAEERLRFEHDLRALTAIRDGFLGDLRALGAEIVQATDRYDSDTADAAATQEHLPVFDGVVGLDPVADAMETSTPAGDANAVTRS